MARTIYTPQWIASKLREAEGHLSHGSIMGEAVRRIEVSEQTQYHWQRQYRGMRIGEITQPKEPELDRLII